LLLIRSHTVMITVLSMKFLHARTLPIIRLSN
jgi:hypothetical protein